MRDGTAIWLLLGALGNVWNAGKPAGVPPTSWPQPVQTSACLPQLKRECEFCLLRVQSAYLVDWIDSFSLFLTVYTQPMCLIKEVTHYLLPQNNKKDYKSITIPVLFKACKQRFWPKARDL